jgi:sterol O-acyltransferase
MHHAKYARRLLGQLVYGLNYERQLTTTSIVAYPANVSVRDLLLFSFAPVLCYEPSFPRTEGIRPAYLAEKIFLAAGLLTAGIYVLSHYVLPVVDRIGCLGEVDAAVQLMVPLMAIMLLLFFLIFECVLNAFAELTRFGARSHYGDWWNATTFLEWSRAWNLPVHDWLARHVYLDAMRQYGAAPNAALTFTFLVSIVLHEVVIWGVLGRLTMPWLGLFSLLQLPLGSIQRVAIIKGKRLGNMILWAGLAIGVALIFTLYAKEVAPPCPSA